MRTNFVLIDFESVQPESLAALEQDHFKIIVFVGANQTKVSVDVATTLQRRGTSAEYIRISGNGKNALDFHIAYYIGKLAAQEPTAYFHIISKDTGFDPLIQHLKSKGIFAARSTSITDIPLAKVQDAKSPDQKARLFITKLEHPKATRPRTLKTLSNAIAAFFQKQLSETEVAAVVASLQKAGFLSVTDGKVSYAPGV